MSMRLGENILPHLQNKGKNGDETTLTTTEIESAISTEKTRAERAEETLQGKINTLDEKLDSEIERAEKAESDEKERAELAEKTISDKLDAEISRAKESETNIDERAKNAEASLEEKIDKEIEDRTSAVSAEMERAKEAEKTLSDNLDTETSERKSVIEKEIKDREDADLVEEKARRSAINAVEYSISSERERALIQETSLEKAITTEKTAREEAIKKEVEDRNTAISNAISALDSEDEEVDGQFISKVVGEDGVITITRKSFSDKVTEGDTNAPSGDAVYQAIQALGTLYELKGSVENFDSLPTEKKAGDVYNTTDTGDNYVWTGTEWDRLGGSTIVDALDFADPAANGVNLSFISSISQTNGKITAQKKTVQDASSRQKGVVFTTPNIEKTGTSVPTSSAVWSHVDDKISAEVKNRNTAISDAISQEVEDRNTAISNAINALDVTDTAEAGKYISSVSEENGVISVSRASLPTSLPASDTVNTYSETSTAPISGKGVAAALGTLDSTPTGTGAGKTIATLSEEDGIISATFQDISITKSQVSDYEDYVLPTANASTLGGVKSTTTGTTANRDYNVEVNSDGTMKVNVPWVDTNTDTKNTAGSTNSTSKVYLVGAASQSESAQTYSNSQVYEQDGNLYAKEGESSSKVMTEANFASRFSFDSTSGILTITI